MADNSRSFAPGTFEHTRQNIGPIDDAEAREMQKKLGGEILPERSEPVDTSNMPKRAATRRVIKSSGLSSSDISSKSAALNISQTPKNSVSTSQIVNGSNSKSKKTDDDNLPPMSAKDLKLIEALMMSNEYKIKPNYGLFNFLYRMSAKNRQKVSPEYGQYRIKTALDHLQGFVSTIKTFIQISPDTYKAKIATDTDLKFKFLRTVGKWTIHDLKKLSLDIEAQADDLNISALIPFVSAVYHQLLTVYYIGEQRIPALIKEIFTDITNYPKVDKAKVQDLARQAMTEWLYVSDLLIKGMYPLLMRMCASEYVEYPRFFTAQIVQILRFAKLTKFDLLIPEKKKEGEREAAQQKENEEEKKDESGLHIAGQKNEIVDTGLKILNQLFPDAGFDNLSQFPDMYPYFQPIYKFEDGFNMLSPKNPVQITLVLIKIIADFFQGCRNINFNIKADEKLDSMPDTISDVFTEWNSYKEDLFDKKYGDYLRDFVNSTYSQKDYPSTQYGKESINNMLWRTKYYYLPNYKFNAPVLTKPANDSKYKPLYARTDYVRTVFSTLARRIDENQAAKTPVLGVLNPWNRYFFEIPNAVSKRLDVLLGAKKDDNNTNATNANLIKYTLCVVSVLDWWLNNPASPAYFADTTAIYRISPKDGAPEFSAPERNDQNQLFAESIKKAISAKK